MGSVAVTVFGDGDALDLAVSDVLADRGDRTHLVTVPSGWIGSADPVVLRLDTTSGAEAFRNLADHEGHGERVVALCLRSARASSVRGVRILGRSCSRSHDVTLVWHDAVVDPAQLGRLAVAVAEQVDSRSDPHFDEVALLVGG